MIQTIAKAETAESVPAFAEKFAQVSDLSSHCAELKRLGYTHYVNMRTARVTIGNILGEYRIMSAAAFFKGVPPTDMTANLPGEIPFIENRKFYSEMSSVGRDTYGATLAGEDMMSWIEFFEANAGHVSEIDELI